MQTQRAASHRLGRRTRLAQAVGLALSLGVSGALAAQPGPTESNQAWMNPGATSNRGEEPAPANQSPHGLRTRNNGAVVYGITSLQPVANCNDHGPGSLREAVAGAASGDTIDLSGLSCDTIKLTSSIITFANDLTLQGKPGTFLPSPVISGQDSVTPLVHLGTGTLALHNLQIAHGYYAAEGGCIFSSGDIEAVGTTVKYCTSKGSSGSPAIGGAIYAKGDVELDSSLVLSSQAIATGSGTAAGGGIYSGGTTYLSYGSVVKGNVAVARGSGGAYGGGIDASGGLNVTSSIIDGNSARSASGPALGGGAITSGQLDIAASEITGNHADTKGGGLFVDYCWAGGNTKYKPVVKYSTIAGNDTDGAGGGIYAACDLTVGASTISGNHAYAGGGLVVMGDASVAKSTISNNTAASVGGAALTGDYATQAIQVIESTISGNQSSGTPNASGGGYGAGLFLGHAAIVKNSTITGNVERTPTDTRAGAGLSLRNGISLTLSSSIVSGNRIVHPDDTSDPSGIAVADSGAGATVSGDFNVVGQIAPNVTDSTTHLISDATPGLGPLQDNGGFTDTHMPLPGSPALGWGLDNGYDYDQRGQGFRRSIGWTDAGAVERLGDRIFADGFEIPVGVPPRF